MARAGVTRGGKDRPLTVTWGVGDPLPPRVHGRLAGELEVHVPLLGLESELGDLVLQPRWWGAEAVPGHTPAPPLEPRRVTREALLRIASASPSPPTHRSVANTTAFPLHVPPALFARYLQDAVRGSEPGGGEKGG